MSVDDSLLNRLRHELAAGERRGEVENAAQITAASGLSTRVPTIVAMEFAESWKPLMKSKTNATRTIATT